MAQPVPFRIAATDAQLDDLRARLRGTRWPEAETVDDWSQGTPLAFMRAMADHWAGAYDWRAREAKLNALTQWRAEAEGVGLHFVHMRSPHPQALPLLLIHGWPGSIVEFAKAIPRLVDPVAFGGRAEDAFHVVAPSLPGFGFSDRPAEPGMNVQRMARLFDTLMRGLGYDRYVVQGGDWGAIIATCIGSQNLGACAAIHVTMPIGRPTAEEAKAEDAETRDGLAAREFYDEWDSGYAKQQGTRPQSLAYGLTDSPVGQAAWILEKFHAWTDCDGDPLTVLGRDELLDNVMLYWLPGTAASAARIYWESHIAPFAKEVGPVKVPTGVSLFPKEIFRPTRAWAERLYPNITSWRRMEKGGHFAAFEQPGIFVDEVRGYFTAFRG